MNKPINDPIQHPTHYCFGGIECIDAIYAALTCHTDPVDAWLTGQVLKYMWRWPLKNGLEDLRKARFYLNRLIERAETAAEEAKPPYAKELLNCLDQAVKDAGKDMGDRLQRAAERIPKNPVDALRYGGTEPSCWHIDTNPPAPTVEDKRW